MKDKVKREYYINLLLTNDFVIEQLEDTFIIKNKDRAIVYYSFSFEECCIKVFKAFNIKY